MPSSSSSFPSFSIFCIRRTRLHPDKKRRRTRTRRCSDTNDYFLVAIVLTIFVFFFLNRVHAILPETKSAIDRSGCANHETFLKSRRTRQMWENEAIVGPYALLHRSPRESEFFNRVLVECGCRDKHKNENVVATRCIGAEIMCRMAWSRDSQQRLS